MTEQSSIARYTPPFIRTRDGIGLACSDWNPGAGGRPVVFVHAWALESGMWDYVIPELTGQGVRCITYDARGHGRSDRPGHGYDYDTMANDLAAVITQLDLRNAVLVGYSMGCGTVLNYLDRHGADRVGRVALLSGITPMLLRADDNPAGIDPALATMLGRHMLRDFAAWTLESAAPFFRPDTSPAMVAWGVQMMNRISVPVAMACRDAMLAGDFRAVLRRITLPALVVHGTADASAPFALTGQRTAELLPSCRLIVYEGAPHGLFATDAGRLAADLFDFIRG